MAPKKEGTRTRRKMGSGRGDSERGEGAVEKADGQARDVTMVDVDPWGSFFEKFWGQTAEGGSTDQHDGGPKTAKTVQASGTRPASQGRSPRAS